MYDLTIGLKYDDVLKLEQKYRYDFVGIDYRHDAVHEHIFVFRTIKEGKGKGNILIDLVHPTNIHAINANLHGDCHFHIFKNECSIGDQPIEITENIFLEKIENVSNFEYYVSIKEQKYRSNNKIPTNDSDYEYLPTVKYLLFTQYHEPLANMNSLELAPMFKLQKEHIWHNNRYFNFNRISSLDVDKQVNRKLDPSTPWWKVKNIIEDERKHWRKESEEKYNQLLHLKSLQEYFPIE